VDDTAVFGRHKVITGILLRVKRTTLQVFSNETGEMYVPLHIPPVEQMEALRHIQKTERIVRLEIQRRAVKDTIRIYDEIQKDVDEQLHFVSQFKREWLALMKVLEVSRQEVVAREVYSRNQVEAEWRQQTESLIVTEWLPPLRKMRPTM
jgi:hypothetical protein